MTVKQAVINSIINNLKKINLEIKYDYKNEDEFINILKKITKPLITNAEKYNLSFEVDEDSIYIKRNKKIVAIFDNYITDLTNDKENYYKDIIILKEKNQIRKYRLGIINNKEGFIYQDNKRKGNRIIKKYIETYYHLHIT